MVVNLPTMIAVGWSHLCAALLVISGGNKLFDPEPTRGALREAGLPSFRLAAIGLGVWEILAGSVALVFGEVIGGALLIVTYAGFALFVGWALVREIPIQSCGCFGRETRPQHGLT